MKISTQQYAQSLYESVSALEKTKIKEAIHNFILILAQHNDLGRAEEIIENLQRIWDRENGELTVELASARHLAAGAKEAVAAYLQAQAGAAKIVWQEKLDPSLLGGFVLRYNSRVIDGSLCANLADLKNKLSN